MACDAPLILSFDTSAARCAAALVSGQRVAARRVEKMARGQAERLFPMLEELLGEAGQAWRDLAAIAVCTGPGNFTGIRIAVSGARGLSLSLGIPAIGVTAFEALAHGRAGRVLCLADNGRGQPVGQVLRDGVAEGAPPAAPGTLGLAGRGIPCIGFEARRVAASLGLSQAEEIDHPDPAAIAAAAALRNPATEPRPAPLYLRPPDAAPSSVPAPRILDDA